MLGGVELYLHHEGLVVEELPRPEKERVHGGPGDAGRRLDVRTLAIDDAVHDVVPDVDSHRLDAYRVAEDAFAVLLEIQVVIVDREALPEVLLPRDLGQGALAKIRRVHVEKVAGRQEDRQQHWERVEAHGLVLESNLVIAGQVTDRTLIEA